MRVVFAFGFSWSNVSGGNTPTTTLRTTSNATIENDVISVEYACMANVGSCGGCWRLYATPHAQFVLAFVSATSTSTYTWNVHVYTHCSWICERSTAADVAWFSLARMVNSTRALQFVRVISCAGGRGGGGTQPVGIGGGGGGGVGFGVGGMRSGGVRGVITRRDVAPRRRRRRRPHASASVANSSAAATSTMASVFMVTGGACVRV
mmetsp:Transcript_50038/g.122913  ORF Transcript_50038/g.122913 Transcript_50038/m.122913 type:complete len:207 (-) Transcript_50038:42-662(-)